MGTDAEFESLSSITLQYSVPDANGNQSISMSGTVNWDGNPFSGSDTFTGTLNTSNYADLFLDDHLASVPTVQGDTDVYTIGFVDYGGQRTVEKTNYVTQLLQYRAPRTGMLVERYSYNYDFLAFVMGDQTWASDMPSSGSATYNGFTQMLMSFEFHDTGEIEKDYLNGTSTFTADFASRNISGRLEFDYGALAYQANWGEWINPDEWWFKLENGTISGTSFSGTVTIPGLTNIGDISSSFTGNFYGPNATELGRIFNYSNENLPTDTPGVTGSFYAIGTFTGCQGC